MRNLYEKLNSYRLTFRSLRSLVTNDQHAIEVLDGVLATIESVIELKPEVSEEQLSELKAASKILRTIETKIAEWTPFFIYEELDGEEEAVALFNQNQPEILRLQKLLKALA